MEKITGYNIFNASDLDLADDTGTDTGVETIWTNKIVGTNSDDILRGTEENDEIIGWGGNDYLYGETGDDYLDAGGGNDHLYGGAGDDLLYGGTGDDYLYGGASDDQLSGEEGNDYLEGGLGKDTFTFFYRNTLGNSENLGNDIIADYTEGEDCLSIGGPGGSVKKTEVANNNQDLVFTVNSKSTITVSDAANKTINMGDYTVSNTTVELGESFYGEMDASVFLNTVKNIYGQNALSDVTLKGNGNANNIFGGLGSDTLYGGDGADRLFGGAGADTLNGDAGDDVLNGQEGDDKLKGGYGKDTFVYCRDQGNDTIYDYTPGEDIIELESGYISATVSANYGNGVKFTIGNGSVTLQNGAGKTVSIKDGRGSFTVSDTTIRLDSDFGGTISAAGYLDTVKNIYGQSTTKKLTINGNGNDNDIFGGPEADSLYGGLGTDRLFGQAGDDYLYGEAGNDKLYGNEGNDHLYGGAGDDCLYGQSGSDEQTGGAGKDTFVHYKSYENDTITDYTAGEDAIDIASGYISKAVLVNSGKDIKFTVGEGSVTVQNGAGKAISIKDGRGSFTVSSVTITLGSDFGGTISAAGYLNTVKNIYGQNAAKALTINGNGSANEIFGGSGADTLSGGAGADRLFGQSGSDALYGDAGNDKLYGNAGNDKLYGGAGDDTLYGQSGEDELTGGAGNDTFVHYKTYDNDTITDYTAEEDTIDIASGYISKTVLVNSSKDVKFTVGEGSVTVQNGAEKTISIKDSRGSFTVSGVTITLGSDFGGTISAAGYLATVNSINGQNSEKALTINGNGNDNVIYGGNAADNLYGGAGNNYLYGGDDSDVFAFNSSSTGNNVIKDFEADIIKFNSNIGYSNGTVEGDDVLLTLTNGGSIIIEGGKDQVITFEDTSGIRKTYTFS